MPTIPLRENGQAEDHGVAAVAAAQAAATRSDLVSWWLLNQDDGGALAPHGSAVVAHLPDR
jgi:hypothetical protein